MELERFEQAKKIKEDLDKLERQKRKLESALESCSLNVTIEFSPSRAFLTRKDEVSIYTKDLIKELVSKELEMLNHQIEFKKEKFENV
jgi:hypothetical protein